MKHYCTFYTLKKYKKLLRKRTHRLQNLKSLARFAFRAPQGITLSCAAARGEGVLSAMLTAKLVDNKTKEHWFVHCYTNELTDNKTKEHWFVHCYTNELTDNKTLFCHCGRI